MGARSSVGCVPDKATPMNVLAQAIKWVRFRDMSSTRAGRKPG